MPGDVEFELIVGDDDDEEDDGQDEDEDEEEDDDDHDPVRQIMALFRGRSSPPSIVPSNHGLMHVKKVDDLDC